MVRPRKEKYADLPPNLHVLSRTGGDYFTYRSPISKTSVSIGYSRENAIRYAIEANSQLAAYKGSRSHARESVKHGSVDHRGLLDAASIGRKALIYEHVCGVYFLLRQDTIVYVGQSINVLTRIADHKREGIKNFDRIFVVQCSAVELNHLEALYIDKFRPIHNTVIPPVSPNATAWEGTLSDILGDASCETV
jgi:hypothetical protein